MKFVFYLMPPPSNYGLKNLLATMYDCMRGERSSHILFYLIPIFPKAPQIFTLLHWELERF